MKQSLENPVGGRAVSGAGVASAQVADLVETASETETETEAGVLTRTAETGMPIYTTPKVGVGPALAVEIEVDAALDRVVDLVEADVPTNSHFRQVAAQDESSILFTHCSPLTLLCNRASRRVNS
jgi:hypothetical protein